LTLLTARDTGTLLRSQIGLTFVSAVANRLATTTAWLAD